MFKLINPHIQNDLPWTDPTWILTQLIFELTIPKSNDYLFDLNSIKSSLLSLNISQYLPFYHTNYEPQQSETEKKLIVTFFIKDLGFPVGLLDNDYSIDDLDAQFIADNIIKKMFDLNLIK